MEIKKQTLVALIQLQEKIGQEISEFLEEHEEALTGEKSGFSAKEKDITKLKTTAELMMESMLSLTAHSVAANELVNEGLKPLRTILKKAASDVLFNQFKDL